MRKQLAMGIVLASMAAAASAQDENPAFYAGLGVGEASLEDSIDGFSVDGSDTAFKLFGGYRFNRNLSVELAYIDAGNPEDTIFDATVETDASAIQASVLGTLPVNDRFGIYLRGSILSWEADNTLRDGSFTASESVDGTDFGYGIGAIFGVTQNFKIRGEFEGADLDGTDLTLFSISGAFSF